MSSTAEVTLMERDVDRLLRRNDALKGLVERLQSENASLSRIIYNNNKEIIDLNYQITCLYMDLGGVASESIGETGPVPALEDEYRKTFPERFCSECQKQIKED